MANVAYPGEWYTDAELAEMRREASAELDWAGRGFTHPGPDPELMEPAAELEVGQ